MFNLTGKTALVTGASGGIGGAIASCLHQAGATVVLHGTRREALDRLAATLGERVHVIPADLSNPEAVEALAKTCETTLGASPDILVNNAGIVRDTLVLRMKDDDWEKVLSVNLTAAFRLSRAVLRGMTRRRWGRIINISSVVATTGNPGQANYCAAKAGMIGMTKSMAQEVASRSITVNAVAPGFIATAIIQDLSDAQKARLLENIPTGRMGTSEDVAAAVLYLASEEASYVTGQTIHVNGGLAMP